jgi:hypothetical protein
MIKKCNLNKSHDKSIVIGILEPMEDISITHGECRSCIVKESMAEFDRKMQS